MRMITGNNDSGFILIEWLIGSLLASMFCLIFIPVLVNISKHFIQLEVELDQIQRSYLFMEIMHSIYRQSGYICDQKEILKYNPTGFLILEDIPKNWRSKINLKNEKVDGSIILTSVLKKTDDCHDENVLWWSSKCEGDQTSCLYRYTQARGVEEIMTGIRALRLEWTGHQKLRVSAYVQPRLAWFPKVKDLFIRFEIQHEVPKSYDL